MNNQELLTRTECNVLRGLAIIGIVMHNFCHWLNPIVKENEYQYFSHNVEWFWQVMLSPDEKMLAHLFSFFGHYGVPVFLFLSAYGLVRKYESREETMVQRFSLQSLCFVRYHFLKLFKMMIVGFVAFTMVDAITPGSHHYAFLDVVAQMGMFNNLLPHPDDIIWPGPYWFFGLMLQLYIVYRLFLYRRNWKWIVGAIVVCWLLQIFCDPEGDMLNRIRYNFIGGMLPFGLGILYAKYGRPLSQQQNAIMLIVSTVLILIFSSSYQLWYFVPAFVCTFCIGFVKTIGKMTYLFNHLDWVGSISAAMFVCHPITRKVFIPISRQGDLYCGLLLYVIATIALSWVFREFMKKIPSPKLK